MTTATTASNNNNANVTASSAAVLTGSGTIVPLVAHGSHGYHQHSTRYQPRSQQQLQQQQQQQQHLQQQQHHYSYSYHHPQFGNMAVPMRQYEQQPLQQQQHHQQHQQHSGVYADDAYSAYHHHHHSSSNSNNSRYATPRRHNSSSNMRHTTATTATSAATASVTAAAVPVSATPIPPTQAQAVVTGQGNQLQQQHHALLQHADSQLLPSHLKCGMCASLVLASVFVAGAKFYFDHQGTGLEVFIFCGFSVTFILAACMMSMCRIPSGLLSSRTNGRAVCHSRGVNAGGNVSSCMLELNDVRYLDERQVEVVSAETAAAAAAGPPPYHIAILLPEQTPTALGKQLPLDESPPPSYDKILV
ncbi:GH14676 [Drosophila grimshawi]|uniref:GH14676 n=2 Tax=Drosophila grimshawi TaxID=7222 RepID=B4IXM0_DROGR|nr:GH14676 [Drosophila grimshawi]